MSEKSKSNIKFFIFSVFFIICFLLFLFYPQYCIEGIKSGLYICFRQIIPALFPFCVLSAFFLESRIAERIGKFFAPVTEFLFKLPGQTGSAILVSMCAGYPVGAITAQGLYEKGQITKNEYKRLMLFCVNAGPAFVVGAVGEGMMKNKKAGLVMLLSLTLSAVTMGIISGFFKEEEKINFKERDDGKVFYSDAFIKSVQKSIGSVTFLCAFVLIFSCAAVFWGKFIPNQNLRDALICTLEVTRGCKESLKYKNELLTVFILGWAGVSVHFQVLGYVRKSGLKITHFLCARLINAALACLYCKYLLMLFPSAKAVFGSMESPVPRCFSFSVYSSLSMILMGVFLVLELDRKYKKC